LSNIYTTNDGDTWDSISFEIYGSEKYTHLILDANIELTDIVFFDSGTELIIPDISELSSEETSSNLPPWRVKA